MEPFTVSTTISRPRPEVYEYLSDIANHAEFTDHYLVDWHLTREESVGQGAGARFRVKAPLNRFAWADVTFIEMQPPFRIVERGRGGKYNRIRMLGTYTLS
ncbi:MAG TPA: SRPBCC family protein, partial [Solirubrobacteraceae bacterium]|nr:SRPBCC family protein [Solirubrobacteraceae bacterium]